MVATVTSKSFFASLIIFYFFFINSSLALEIIRDEELEKFTKEITAELINNTNIDVDDINFYFINNKEINAFVTGGKNIFINTGLITKADDYREYQAVIAHELSHIIGGHIFNTSAELRNLSNKALPVYLLGIVGIFTGSADTAITSIMLGQASVQDGYTYYSRNQEASADQAAISLMCSNNIDASYLGGFLEKMDRNILDNFSYENYYRSTHPPIDSRKEWIKISLKNKKCKFESNQFLQKKFNLLKSKLIAFTHSKQEVKAIYNGESDKDLYANAIISYLSGNHMDSLKILKKLINREPKNPYFRELLGEIYFAKADFNNAIKNQTIALELINEPSDLYFMMIGNYLISVEDVVSKKDGIKNLKKSIFINPNNTYSWYLLARAYADTDNLPLANYATAERYYLIGERRLALEFAQKSINSIEKNSPEWYRANDLVSIISSSLIEESSDRN